MSTKGLALLALATGCAATPLTNRLKPGEEPIVVVVGEGTDGAVDLFAAPAEGGQFHQLTFTRAVESLPKLAPSGVVLAFVRRGAGTEGGRADGRMSGGELVIVDLIGGTERTVGLEAMPSRLGWFPGGDTVAVATAAGVMTVALGPGKLAAVAAGPRADSLSYDRVGTPAFGSLRPCRAGGLCVISDAGEETALAEGAADGCRWGDKALAYVRNGKIEVRPLGGGRVRQPTWNNEPTHLRQPTHHPGSDAR